MKRPMVEITLELGALKPVIQKAAKASGVSMNEFINNAIESKVRRAREYSQGENFTPHGGKRLMGKHSGYEVTKDGKYYPARTWTDRFDLLFAERQATYNLVNAVIAQVNGRLVEIEKQIAKTKVDLVDELGLDATKHWSYYGDNNYLVEHVDAPKE